MNFSRFFVDRPIFAAVIAIFITLIGAFAYPQLPLAQYPEIAPPTINVTAAYPGASSETIAETVASTLEQEINGVEDMLYLQSSSTQGQVQITVTFQPGTDLDAAQVLVQNRVALAEPRLPEQVRQIGVQVNKQESGFLMIVALTSSDPAIDVDYVGNYANSTLRDRLLRLEGVGGVQIFGGGFYSMRIWIDPDKAAARGLTAPEIVAALQSQNVQVAERVGRRAALWQGQSRLRASRPGSRPPRQPRPVRQCRDQDRHGERRDHPGQGHRPRRARRAGLWHPRPLQRPAGRRHGGDPAAGRQRARRREPRAPGGRGGVEGFPAGARIFDSLQPDRICRGVGRGGAGDAGRGDLPRRARRARLPADLARRDHPDHRDPGRARRYLRRPARARLLDQFAVAVRAGARGRHRRRRRDRRRRGGRKAYPRGADPARGRAPDDGRGVGRAGRDRAGARRGVRADRLRPRHPRHLLSAVRGDDRRRDGLFAAHLADAVARDGGAAAATARGASRTAEEPGHALHPQRRRQVQPRLRHIVRPLRPHHRVAGPQDDGHARHLCGAARGDRLAPHRDPDRLHSRPGPGHPDRRRPAAPRRLARPHQRGARTRAEGSRQGRGREQYRDLRRARRRQLLGCVEQPARCSCG